MSLTNSTPTHPYSVTTATVLCLAGLHKDLTTGTKKEDANQSFLTCVQAAVIQDRVPKIECKPKKDDEDDDDCLTEPLQLQITGAKPTVQSSGASAGLRFKRK